MADAVLPFTISDEHAPCITDPVTPLHLHWRQIKKKIQPSVIILLKPCFTVSFMA